MRVKKFEAKSMKEALQMVKQEMGPDAVILSARDNRKKFGLGGDGSVEVTAAVSEQTLHKKKFVESRMNERDLGRFQGSPATLQKKVIATAVERKLRANSADQAKAAGSRLADVFSTRSGSTSKGTVNGKRDREITPISYIDISDDDDDQSIARRVERSARRIPAVSRSAASGAPVVAMQTARTPQPQSRTAVAKQAANSMTTMSAGAGQAIARAGQISRGIGQSVSRALQSQLEIGTSEVEHDIDDESFQYHRLQRAAKSQSMDTDMQNEVISPLAKKRIQSAARDALQAGIAAFSTPQTHSHSAPSFSVPSMDGQATNSGEASPLKAKQDIEVLNLQQEVQRLQKVIENFGRTQQAFVTPHPGAEFGVNFDLSFMYQKLISTGVNQELAVEMLLQCQKELDPLQQKKRPMVDAWIAKKILQQIQVVERPCQARIHSFVGPNGSGKTSTLIKMASQLVVTEKKRVAIVTTDTFKVGAVDQLKIFCQILNVPLAIAKSRHEWEWLLQQLGNFDYILTDFPGMQLGELEEMSKMKSLLPPTNAGISAVHLVLPATGKDSDLLEIARRYKASGYQDLIFTNLDQSVHHGVIYNVQQRAGVPLHSFSTGSRIPEDFENATKERVLDLIFKLSRFPKER